MSVQIVIVNYRTGRLACECLDSLAPEIDASPRATVVVADNASGDGSADEIQRRIDERAWSWASTLRLDRNGGFAWGNNEVIRRSLAGASPPELFWLLNPDTVVRPGALTSLARFMQENPLVGIAGGRTENPDGSPQVSAFRFPSVFGEVESSVNWGAVTRLLARWRVSLDDGNDPRPVDWVSGASMMVRRSTFERLGLLDERYFAYCEEMDLCLAARRAGIPVWHVPQSRVVHLVGQASGVTIGPRRPSRRPAFWFHSRRWYWVKNHGILHAALADAARILGTLVCRAKLLVSGEANWMPPSYLIDLVRYSVFICGGRPGPRGGVA